ncbi:MAG: STAS domain-containing protein [Gammaproteobacteria bacterium]|nr:STAS domain-containing protein [Gammaproteobacteria bacterium]
MVESTDADKTVINCEPTIDISAAQALFEHLSNALSGNHAVEINAGDVTRVDAAILQVFTAFMLESKTREQSVTWNSVSDAFYGSAEQLGLVNELSLPAR